MKKVLGYLFLGILLTILNSCEKAPINNRIEGHWKLEQITTLENNVNTPCERIFYSITRMVTEVAEKQGPHHYGSFIARTEYQNNETILVLKDFKRRASTSDNGVPATKEQLMPFGINNPKETKFNVIESTSDRLVLESDYARLILKKF